MPLLIIGGKYDLFQVREHPLKMIMTNMITMKDLEPEKKKTICRAIRFLGHYHGATVHWHTSKDPGLVKKVRGSK